MAEATGLRVVNARSAHLSDEDAYAVSAAADGVRVAAGAAVALQVIGANAAEKLGAVFALASDELRLPPNAFVRASATGEAALATGFFGAAATRLPCARARAGADYGASACALVLPHVLLAGSAGAVLADLCGAVRASNDAVAPLAVVSVRIMDLSRAQAEEFLEVYKDVVPEYPVRSFPCDGERPLRAASRNHSLPAPFRCCSLHRTSLTSTAAGRSSRSRSRGRTPSSACAPSRGHVTSTSRSASALTRCAQSTAFRRRRPARAAPS
jgi:hypothetical protein